MYDAPISAPIHEKFELYLCHVRRRVIFLSQSFAKKVHPICRQIGYII